MNYVGVVRSSSKDQNALPNISTVTSLREVEPLSKVCSRKPC